MGVGMGEKGSPWILKISTKKGCFLKFRVRKNKCHHFWPLLEKSPSGPPGKNPSDVHVSTYSQIMSTLYVAAAVACEV